MAMLEVHPSVTIDLDNFVVVNTPVDLLFLLRRRFARLAPRSRHARPSSADLPVTNGSSECRWCRTE